MKKHCVVAPKQQLQALATKKAAWLQAHGARRVLVVYDDAQHARVYPEARPKP